MERIGDMDRRIELQSRTLPSGGDPTAVTWATQVTVWAERLDARGAERYVGSQFAAEASQAYRIRHRSDIDPTWRVKDGAELWNVQAVLPGKGRGVELVLLVRRLDPEDES